MDRFMNRFNRLDLSPVSILHDQAHAREISHGGSPLQTDIDSQSLQLFNMNILKGGKIRTSALAYSPKAI